MIVLMRPDATPEEIEGVLARVRELGFEPHVDRGRAVVIGVRGDTATLDENAFHLPGVREIRRLTPPYRVVSRASHPADRIVEVAGVRFGGSQPVLIGGPCAVESRAQLLGAARAVRDAGGAFLRGGAFKPRTSPYTFQGLGEEGLKILSDVREETGVPVVTEMTSVRQLPLFDRYAVDLVQVGARSMYNYDLLQELGRRGRPVLLKRAFSATLEELLLAAEYLVTSGSDRVVLCERGIRAFEPAYRFTLDLNAVAYLREKTHLPVIVDPSHGTGSRSMVERMSFAAIAAGAQGLLVEVHPNPARARSDAGQQLAPDEFRALAERVRGLWTYLRSPGAFSPV